MSTLEPKQKAAAVRAYQQVFSTFAHGMYRLYSAHEAYWRVQAAIASGEGLKIQKQIEELESRFPALREAHSNKPPVVTPQAIQGALELDEEVNAAFSYLSQVSHLVHATALFDTFLTESTMFLFLLFPQSMGGKQQIPLQTLLHAKTRNEALTSAARTRSREVSFKTFADRIGFLREQFGLLLEIPSDLDESMARSSELRNMAVHNQGVFDLSLNEEGDVTCVARSSLASPVPVSPASADEAADAYGELFQIIARAIFAGILGVSSAEIPRVDLPRRRTSDTTHEM